MGEKNIVWKGDFKIDLVKQDSLTVMRHHADQQIKKLIPNIVIDNKIILIVRL